MSDVNSEVRTIISNICEIPEKELKDGVNLIDDLDIDSIDFMDITYEIDQKYAIKLPVENWMDEVNSKTSDMAEYFVMEKFCAHISELIEQS